VELKVTGLSKVIETLNKFNKLDEVIERRIKPELGFFSERIKGEQMSGRPGLNEGEGVLKSSLETGLSVSGNSLEFMFGSDVEYMAVHQYGSSTIPKRLYVEEAWTEFVETDILSLIESSALQILEETGGRA